MSANQFGVGAAQATGSGDTFELIVTARKADGSIDHDFTGTVHFTSSDGNATLPGDSNDFNPSGQGLEIILGLTNGQAAHPTVLRTLGTQTITVNQVSRPHVTGTGTILVGRAGHTVVWSPHYIYSGTNRIGEGDGVSWGQTMNWNVDRLPAADDDVFLGSNPVTLNSIAAAATLVFAGNASVTVSNSSLTVAGNTAFKTLNIAGGSFNTTATATVSGATYWIGGTINLTGGGTLNANGGLNLSGGAGPLAEGRDRRSPSARR